jgi:hypothetical protein
MAGDTRWEQLFADLEAELAAAGRVAVEAELVDRTRGELARISFVDRLRAGVGRPVRVHVHGAAPVSGRLAACGTDWLLVDAGTAEVLVPVAAVLGVDGLARWSASPDAPVPVVGRLALASCLRRFARDRAEVRCSLRDGSTVTGTVDRVGSDLVDLALHPEGEPRRPAAVAGVRTVPFAAMATVRRAS